MTSHPRRAYCTQCTNPVDTRADSGNYQQVIGFVKLRRRGANEVALKRRKPVFICSSCMMLMKAGMNPAQEGLFDA